MDGGLDEQFRDIELMLGAINDIRDTPNKKGKLSRNEMSQQATKAEEIFTMIKAKYPSVDTLFQTLDKLKISKEEHFWVCVTRQVNKQYDILRTLSEHMDVQVREKLFAGILRDAAVDFLKEEIAGVAQLDELTHLPRRRKLFFDLNEMMKNSDDSTLVVCMLDFDGFKAINDEYGHDGGDDTLRKVADRGAKFCSQHEGCSFYRYGGEEFTLLLKVRGKDANNQEIKNLIYIFYAEVFGRLITIRSQNKEKSVQNTYTYTQTCSIGAFIPKPKTTPESILTQADRELLAAKKSKMSTNLEERITLHREVDASSVT